LTEAEADVDDGVIGLVDFLHFDPFFFLIVAGDDVANAVERVVGADLLRGEGNLMLPSYGRDLVGRLAEIGEFGVDHEIGVEHVIEIQDGIVRAEPRTKVELQCPCGGAHELKGECTDPPRAHVRVGWIESDLPLLEVVRLCGFGPDLHDEGGVEVVWIGSHR
jgi:hypothetical protein